MIQKGYNFKLLFSILFIVGAVLLVSGQSKRKRRQKNIDRIVEVSRYYIGTPYKWGGITRSGIDCSGLIYNTYRTIKIKLPRTSKEQSKVGKSKGWGNLRPGDLVYFKFKKKGEKWYHSGIITHVEDGKILFVHSSTSRGVVESNLMSDYYRKNVKKFRRVIN